MVCGLRLLLSGLRGGHGCREGRDERRERRVSDSRAHVLSLAEEELRCKQKFSQEPSGQASVGQMSTLTPSTGLLPSAALTGVA